MTNFEMMRKRLEYQGGIKQEDRMITDKYRTFKKTLQYSYQGCDVQKVQPYDSCYSEDIIQTSNIYRALINPDKTKQDYDDKILSIDYSAGFGPGDVFRWRIWNKKIMDGEPPVIEEEDKSTHWLIYLPALNEDAYFRAEIRLCRHIIGFKDKEGTPRYTWAAIRGPVETQIESIQKNQNRIDLPNLTLNILLPRNEYTLQTFDRYMRFLFADRAWKVLTRDSISTKNIIEITAGEDFINEDKDSNEFIDGLVIQPVDPNPPAADSILGKTFILPKCQEIYEVNHPNGRWFVQPDKENGCLPPVYVEPINEDGKNQVKVIWNKTVSGQFILVWSDDTMILEKTIIVESLF